MCVADSKPGGARIRGNGNLSHCRGGCTLRDKVKIHSCWTVQTERLLAKVHEIVGEGIKVVVAAQYQSSKTKIAAGFHHRVECREGNLFGFVFVFAGTRDAFVFVFVIRWLDHARYLFVEQPSVVKPSIR